MPNTNTPTTSSEGLRITGEIAPGFPPPPRTYASAAYATTAPDSPKVTWIEVRPDGAVVAYAGKVEYGQGIRTGFAVEVADELRVPLSRVTVVLGDTGIVPWDMGTFGSQSTARTGLQLRRAAATARQALLELAADRLDLPVADLRCHEGGVESSHDPGRAVSYADLLAGQLIVRDVTDDAPLTPPAQFTVMAQPHVRRVDAADRVTGRTQYTQDVAVDGMLFAALLRRPSRQASLTSVDTSIAERMPGVARVVQDGHLVAVLAHTDEQAAAALALVRAEWDVAEGGPSDLDMPEHLVRTGADEQLAQESGSLEEGFRAATHVLESTYYVPYVSNEPMEPRAAVARWDGDHLTVWAGSQRPFGIRSELAQEFQVDERLVRVISSDIGGGFGSKSQYPVASEAARLARIAGAPVRVAYTRADELVHAPFRPAAFIRVKSGFQSDGTVVAWQFDAYHAGDRPFIGRRGSETPYAVPNVRVTTYTSESPLRTGSYRSLGGAVNHFAREVHMDEIAEATGVDPVELRLRNLAHPRFRRVLERAAEAHGWSDASRRRGAGVAVGLDVGSYAAICADVAVRGAEVHVDRVTATLDCGLVVNPDGAVNQMEGSIVMGMGTALYESIEFRAGRVLNAGFARYRVPRTSDAPRIHVLLVGDDDTPSTGAGEPGIVPIAPAISNAVFALTGERHRVLPIGRHFGSA
jgi:isoquinoline 1-oxidoreductase